MPPATPCVLDGAAEEFGALARGPARQRRGARSGDLRM